MSPRIVTTEEFLNRVIGIHGDRYDYSKVQYINSHTKVEVICKIHGAFLSLPHNLIKGRGCAICAGNKKLTNESFLERAKAIHGDKYDYSKVSYSTSQKKIKVICPEHGDFQQTAYHHLRGSGCPRCSLYSRISNKDFIEVAKKIHRNRYDYSKVAYNNSREKVTIICPEHGDFQQIPSHHNNGSGCPQCAIDRRKKKKS
tara:strand:+ start:357 stop:956 length:600 start_codon:yes stop_codon:yes gene_type:complete